MKRRVSIAIVRSHNYAPVSTDVPEWPRPACVGEDPELFFPVSTTGPAALMQIEEAKAVCRRCPLMGSCLEGALERNELGVWGGTDEGERRCMKRWAARRRKAA
ncbi:WhiB family transcriptional regulator [Streptomyces sp. NPDC003642]